MSKPNKAVANYRRKVGFPPREPGKNSAEFSNFIDWVIAQAKTGTLFSTIEEAEIAYKKTKATP